ncbi:coiled-coil domain-containing protein 121-like [Microtus ochrogaster]|uniref:Coiled-coil domain-containing protein 121-like n=2 Tax=Microtus ochrogaster TaxID=79684 RepID=A0ABM1AMC7_MICOH|nr:coiled-coil domain-containing protein 121-like [Microtus ochrogaster]
MESQGQGYPSWNTRGRRATIFPQREGTRLLGASALPTEGDTDFLTPREKRHRPPLTRKRAVADFRVRWPDIISREQEAQREDLPQSGMHSLDKKAHDVSFCSSGVSISLKQQYSSHSDFQDSQGSTTCFLEPLSETPHLTILNNYLKPESMTRLEKRVRRKTLVAMNQLEQEMDAAKFRRAVLLKDTRELQDERAFEEAENKPFLEYLKKRNQRTQEKYDFLWKDYIQQCQEIEVRRRELVCTFTSRTVDLQKQLTQGKRLEAGLRKKLKALKPIAQIKENQDREKEALEQEKASIVADIPLMDREAHFQFLKERAALEKQVEELNLLESGENTTRELRKKAKALEALAKKAHKDFCQGVSAENRELRAQLRQLDKEFCELEARREKLEQRKQRRKEQQWYLEALARGRERLQQQESRPPKPQAPHPTQGRLLGARPGTNPK